jgi:RNA polymerase sigma-70 factor, ECF subfamily
METFQADWPHPTPIRSSHTADNADAVLMWRVAAADKNALHILFSRYHLAVYRFVLQRLQDRALAEDVTAAVFLEVWRHASRFEGRTTVLTWILSIARHKTFAARPKIRVRSDATEGPDAPPARDRNAVLRQCLTTLPVEHREVIDLVYYQEQSMASVATILGIPPDDAKTRVFDARKRLADELKKSGIG